MGTKTLMTVEELEQLPDDEMQYELDEGELITMPPAGEEHCGVEVETILLLGPFVKRRSLGRVYPGDMGFRLSAHTVRCPDVAFVRKERLETGRRKGFFNGAPDLAVEIFSPSDSVPQLMRKVQQYLRAGTHTVWVLYPDEKRVHVFEASGKDRILEADEILDAPELLPGFSIQVKALFE